MDDSSCYLTTSFLFELRFFNCAHSFDKLNERKAEETGSFHFEVHRYSNHIQYRMGKE